MDDKEHQFVYQHHYRGRSVHGDLRIKFDNYLLGFTIADMQPDAIEEPVLTLQEAKKYDNDPSVWKIGNKPGGQKMLAFPKASEPIAWLTIEGVTRKPEVGPLPPGVKPEVGGTRQYPGVFSIFDKGTCEIGVQKPTFCELFLHGERFTGRWTIRQIANIYGDRESEPFILLFWKPEEQVPYMLSKRPLKDAYMPPDSISALPKAIRDQVPKELRYWEAKKIDEKFEILKKLLDYKDKIKTKLSSATFLYQRHFWRGPIVIRYGPSRQVFYLHINGTHFVLRDDMRVKDTVGTIEKLSDFWKREGPIPPGSPGNPTKETPSYLENIDEGDVDILDDGIDFKKYNFHGKELKGLYVFKRDLQGDLWRVGKSELPRTVEFSAPLQILQDEEKYIFSGIALAEGTWTESHGNTYTYTREFLKNCVDMFNNVPVDFDHDGKKRGEIVSARLIRDPIYRIEVEGYVLENPGDRNGLSIDAELIVEEDPIMHTNLAVKLLSLNYVSLVRSPACTVCWVSGGDLAQMTSDRHQSQINSGRCSV